MSLDLAYLDKLAKDKNGIKYSLVHQDLFDKNLDAKGKKTKYSKETVRALLFMIKKRNQPKKIWVDKGTEVAGQFENFAKLKAYKFVLQ